MIVHPSHSTRTGFTLIEALVVIAIIGVLVGILLPSLGMARDSARRTQCASNIRKLALASDLYAQDHEERLMPGAADFVGSNLRRWHGARSRVQEPFTPRGGAITPYLDDAETVFPVRECPDFVPRLADLAARGSAFERGCGGYGYNNAFAGVVRRDAGFGGVWLVDTDRTGSARTRFAAPVRTLIFADAALAGEEVIEYSFVEPAWWPESPSYRPDPSTQFRHRGTASIAWLDGHVSWEPLAYSASSGVYPLDPRGVNIGWIAPAESNGPYDYY